jgi:chemotaxis protein methyltransferase CheR
MGVPLMAPRKQAMREQVATAELDPILEGILEKYGYDFRDYARPELDKRIRQFMAQEGIPDLQVFGDRVLSMPEFLQRFLLTMSSNGASMFKEPGLWADLRKDIIPVLRTYPFIRVWHAGCGSGQEAYSMAILLAEEGLYDRCRIYATDLDETSLRKARDGIFSLQAMRKYAQNYSMAGGKRPFSDYYTAKYNSVIINSSLRRNIVFGQHSLVSDGSFNEFQVIFCRNVLGLFNERLREKALGLLHASLGMFGYLVLGPKETVALGGYQGCFSEIDGKHRLYRKVA